MKARIDTIPDGFVHNASKLIGTIRPIAALEFTLEGIKCYIHLFDDEPLPLPFWLPSIHIVSSIVLENWKFSSHRLADDAVIGILSFPEWASDPLYYYKLTEGNHNETSAYANWWRLEHG